MNDTVYLIPPFYEETVFVYDPLNHPHLPITPKRRQFLNELVQTIKEMVACNPKNITTRS